MKESTVAALTLGTIILVAFLIYNFIPNTTTLDTAQANFRKTSEQVKLYVDKKTRDAIEETKVNTKTIEERIAFLEKQDLTKETLELQESVQTLITENGQLKIYIANLEDRVNTLNQVNKAVLEGSQLHYKEFQEYITRYDNLFSLAGVAFESINVELARLDKELKRIDSKEKSVLTKQTIIKRYYCVPKRCCR